MPGFRRDMFISSDTREDLSRRLFLVDWQVLSKNLPEEEEDASQGIVRG